MNVVKVADYSLALYTSSRKPSRTVVSVKWAAPELIVQQPMFTTKSDVWSFGKNNDLTCKQLRLYIGQYEPVFTH